MLHYLLWKSHWKHTLYQLGVSLGGWMEASRETEKKNKLGKQIEETE